MHTKITPKISVSTPGIFREQYGSYFQYKTVCISTDQRQGFFYCCIWDGWFNPSRFT